MTNIFFTSDTHYGHKNLVRGTSSWDDLSGCRDFDTLEEHNECIVETINKTVGKDDILWHLGDWSFGGKDNIEKFRSKIRCREIHLVYGNHDHNIINNPSAQLLFKTHRHYDILDNKHLYWADFKRYTRYPITICHYAMRTYYFNNRGSWCLYGHSHDGLPALGKGLDVGLDSAKRILGEYRPFTLGEIKDYMDARKIYLPDGHTEKTNPR